MISGSKVLARIYYWVDNRWKLKAAKIKSFTVVSSGLWKPHSHPATHLLPKKKRKKNAKVLKLTQIT